MRPLALCLLALVSTLSCRAADPPCFELRTYTASPGRLEALQARFRDHTLGLFARHGMVNVAYWTPKPNPEAKLVYLLAYPGRDARERSWKAFLADPEWQTAKAESEKEGKLVAQVESLFLHPTAYSPKPPYPGGNGEPRLFELRVYRTRPDKLDDLDARFRDHTLALFARHGMTNLPYFHLDEGQEGAGSTLVYLLAHASESAREASFAAFRSDPAWVAARDASEKDGPILVEKGVSSTLLEATDFSPLK